MPKGIKRTKKLTAEAVLKINELKELLSEEYLKTLDLEAQKEVYGHLMELSVRFYQSSSYLRHSDMAKVAWLKKTYGEWKKQYNENNQ